MKKRDNLRRRRAFREPLARFLIVCEGAVTEPVYFNEVRRLERGVVELDISPGGTPKTLVERAVEKKKEAARQAKSGRDQNLEYDHVWCVFDIDEHPLVPDAKQQARDNGIGLAISNPCFELWLLLHFKEQTAHIQRDVVSKRCREHMPGYVKHPLCDRLMPLQESAIQRAEALDQRQVDNGKPGGNPSTTVYRVIRQIIAARAF